MTIAFDLQHDVDKVFEHARTRDGALFRDVSDQHRGHTSFFCNLDQGSCNFTDLCDATWLAVDFCGRNRLHGVDDQYTRINLFDVTEHGCKIGFGCEIQRINNRVDARRTQAHLRCRLLRSDVQRTTVRARSLCRHFDQQRGLADTRFAGQQHNRTRYQSAAEHAIQFRDPGTASSRGCDINTADRHCRCCDRCSVYGARFDRTDFFNGAPRLAFATTSNPLRGCPSAFAAAVLRGDFGHGGTVVPPCDKRLLSGNLLCIHAEINRASRW